jgi:ABC-type glycerol-3-phosphate transport system substrate-binding protein
MNFFTDFANSQRDTYTWNEKMGSSLDQFVNGSLAFFFGYSYHLPIIRGRAPQLNFSVMPMIQLSSDEADFKNVANYSLQTVTAKSRHPGEAWALINYMTHSSANGDYLSATKRPTALRSYISQQKDDNDLKPFVGQLLVAKNWYHGRNYSAAVKALADLFHEWLNPPANLNQDRADKWRSDLLNRTGSRINQTL